MAKEKAYYFPFYYFEYERDTEHLSVQDHGAYFLLLKHYYKTEKPLPLDEKELFRITKSIGADEQESVRKILKFFQQKKDGFHHPKVEEIIEKIQESREKQREKGLKSGQARKVHLETKSQQNANQNGNHGSQKSQQNANQNGNHGSQKPQQNANQNGNHGSQKPQQNANQNGTEREPDKDKDKDKDKNIDKLEVKDLLPTLPSQNPKRAGEDDPIALNFIQQGADYARRSNNPNLQHYDWVEGFLDIQLQEIRKAKPDMPVEAVLSVWRECCDEASARAVTAAKWYHKAFQNRIQAWTPTTAKQSMGYQKPKSFKQRIMEAKRIRNKYDGTVVEMSDLRIENGLLCDAHGNLFSYEDYEPIEETI